MASKCKQVCHPRTTEADRQLICKLFKELFSVTNNETEKVLMQHVSLQINKLSKTKFGEEYSVFLISKVLKERFHLKDGRNNTRKGEKCFIGLKFKEEGCDSLDRSDKETIPPQETLPLGDQTGFNPEPNQNELQPTPFREFFQTSEPDPVEYNESDSCDLIVQEIEAYKKRNHSTQVTPKKFVAIDTQYETIKTDQFTQIVQSENEIINVRSNEFEFIRSEENFLGRGGFGSVYRGKYRDNYVAIKQFRDYSTCFSEYSNQATLIKNIPEVCRAIAVDLSQHILIFPLHLYNNKPTNVGQMQVIGGNKIKAFLMQMAQCLEKLHDMNVLHNDLKGDNVMIDQEGRSVLIDFGNATSIYDSRIRTYSFRHSSHIHPAVRGKKMPYCIASDVWSFGDLISSLKKLKSTTIQEIAKNIKLLAETEDSHVSMKCVLKIISNSEF